MAAPTLSLPAAGPDSRRDQPVNAYSDAELLAALCGMTPEAAAAALTANCGLKALTMMEEGDLAAALGRSRAIARRLTCAMELGRRSLYSPEKRPRLRNPRDIATYLRPLLSGLSVEVFHVLCFNARNTLLRDVRVATGTVNTCPVDPRSVFAAALSAGASGIVLAHNHPSGSSEPSDQDVTLTVKLADAGRVLGVKVLDHVIIADGGFCSLAERGLLLSPGC